jgi:hypothetical protein
VGEPIIFVVLLVLFSRQRDVVGDFAGEAGRRKANSTGSGLVIVDIVCVVRRRELKPQMNDEESARRKTLDLVMIGCSAGSCRAWFEKFKLL